MSADSDSTLSETEAHAGPITREVLSRWRSELREFFSATEQKLNRIRDAATADDRPRPLQIAEPKTSEGPDSHAAAADQSLDRLQSIKRRLAEQLEASRR